MEVLEWTNYSYIWHCNQKILAPRIEQAGDNKKARGFDNSFSRPFTHMTIHAFTPTITAVSNSLTVHHYPIDDLSVSNSVPIQQLLLQLLQALGDGEMVYLHHWGGWGHSGLVGSFVCRRCFSLSRARLDGFARLGAVSLWLTTEFRDTLPVFALLRSPQ